MKNEFTRREFVKVSAAAAALPLAGTALGWPAVHASGSDKIKIGLIGCGGRGTGAAMQAISADPGVVLWSMADVFKDRLDASLAGLEAGVAEAAKDAAEWDAAGKEKKGEKPVEAYSPTNAPPARGPKGARPRVPSADQVQVAPERRFVGFDSFRMVIDSGVDAVILTSYPAFRPEHLKAAIAAGKHVFAEKPLAVDGPGIREVLAAGEEAKRKNLACMIGFCWRHNHGMRAAFERIHSGAIGEITNAHTTYLTSTLGKRPRQPSWSDTEFQLRNWWHFTWISGDHIVEQAVHSIDRLSWALNDATPLKVTCLGGRAARTGPESGDSFDHFAATYEFANGLRAHHTCRQIDGCPSDNTDYVDGTKGRAVVNGWTPTYEILDLKGNVTWKGAGASDEASQMYQNEHDELFKSIREGRPINDCARGANSTLMGIMARMAAYTGQTVTWDQALNSQQNLVPAKLEFGPMEMPALAVPGKTKLS